MAPCRGVAQFGSAFGSGPKGRRFKSCHLDQKKPEIERFPVLFLSLLHKAPSLALFSCNECATLGKGPKTRSHIGRWNWLILGARGQRGTGLLFAYIYYCHYGEKECRIPSWKQSRWAFYKNNHPLGWSGVLRHTCRAVLLE